MTEQEIAGLTRYPLARRGMLRGGLISGFTLATAVVHAQAIKTDTVGLGVGEADVPTADGTLPAYFAHPTGAGPFPIVLVVEEIFGVHEYIKDVCRRLAKAGYFAVATEYYARLGDLSKMTDIQQIISTVISREPDATLMADMDATADWAGGHGGDAKRLGVLGFCRGGRAVWLYAAHSTRLKAAVAFYGPVKSPVSPIQPKTAIDLASQIKCPVLGLYGGQDASISPVDVGTAERLAKDNGKQVEIVIYQDAGHGFHADYRPSYNAKDAQDAWARALAWLKNFETT
jgi:carboxymethylenebutenolidase